MTLENIMFGDAIGEYVTKPQLDHSRTPAAMATYASFKRYEDFAFKLSKLGAHALIWIIHGSPLLIKPHHGKNSTKADDKFREHECSWRKTRLVIFKTNEELDEYIAARNEYHRAKGVETSRTKSETDNSNQISYRITPDTKNARIDNNKVQRCEAFENACTDDGKNPEQLIFSSTYFLSKFTSYDSDVLDIGVICPENTKTAYCFQSPFVAGELSEDEVRLQKDNYKNLIKFFPLTSACKGVDAIEHYVPFIEDLLEAEDFDHLDWVYSCPLALRDALKDPRIHAEWARQPSRRKLRGIGQMLWSTESSFMENLAHLVGKSIAFLFLAVALYLAFKEGPAALTCLFSK